LFWSGRDGASSLGEEKEPVEKNNDDREESRNN
jgi:hypothetical protein